MADLFEPREQRLDVAARITRVARFAPKPLSAPVFFLTVGAVAIIVNYLTLPRLDAVSALSVATFVSIFVGSLAAGLAGFAFSAVTGALLFHWLTPSAAVPLLLACSITTQLFSITALRKTMQWKECIPLLLGGLPGIPVGAYLLQHLGPESFAAFFGVFLVSYAIYMLWRPGTVIGCGGRRIALAVGFAGGIAGGAIAFPGAFPTIWFSLRGLPKDVQRGIVQPFILLMQCAALLYFSKVGIFDRATAVTFLWCVPAVLSGTWIGIRLYRRIDDTSYRRVILGFLLISGATFIL
jgi:uncharacterized membrane protein YfcA